MKTKKTKMAVISGLFLGIIFFMAQYCFGSGEHVMRCRIKNIKNLDTQVEEINTKVQSTINTAITMQEGINIGIYYDNRIKKNIEQLSTLVESLKSEINKYSGVCPHHQCFGCKIYESVIKSADLLVFWIKIMNTERRTDEPFKDGIQYSHFNGYSLAYSMFKQNVTFFYQYYQNEANFQLTAALIEKNHDLLTDVKGEVDELLSYHVPGRFRLSFNYFSGKKNENAFGYIGLSYRFPFSLYKLLNFKQLFHFIPELGINIDGNHHGLVGLNMAYELSQIFYIFGGTIALFPKHDHAKIGWQVGVYKEFMRRLSVGLKYCSHSSVGLNFTILL